MKGTDFGTEPWQLDDHEGDSKEILEYRREVPPRKCSGDSIPPGSRLAIKARSGEKGGKKKN